MALNLETIFYFSQLQKYWQIFANHSRIAIWVYFDTPVLAPHLEIVTIVESIIFQVLVIELISKVRVAWEYLFAKLN